MKLNHCMPKSDACNYPHLTLRRLPNIYDAQAVNAQKLCPGYKATNVKKNAYGLTARLGMAGSGCNVYGNDVAELSLAVQYQSDKRLSVKISPRYLDSTNVTRYEIPPAYVGQPSLDKDAENTVPATDLQFTYTNVPTFGFAVLRKSTGDVLFDTRGKKLIFEVC
jgi:alpha-glucosidase